MEKRLDATMFKIGQRFPLENNSVLIVWYEDEGASLGNRRFKFSDILKNQRGKINLL